MPRTSKVLILIFASLMIIAYFTFDLIIPSIIKNKITHQITDDCETCVFTADQINIHFFPTRLVAQEVHYESGDRKSTLIQADVQRATIPFSLRSLRQHLIKIGTISIERPTVVVTEGDLPGKRTPEDETPSEWNYQLEHVEINDGDFTYKSEHLGKTASIHIGKVVGDIGKSGSTPERRDENVTAHVTALLEGSGKIDLTVNAFLFSKPEKVNVVLLLDEMDLSKIKPFFMSSSGIDISGNLTHGKAEVTVLGTTIRSKVTADYDHLRIDFTSTSERSGLVATLSNLFSGIKPVKNRSRNAVIYRDPGEPLVGWIFRGMKESALKVVTD